MTELIEIDKTLLLWFNGSDSLFLDGFARTFTKVSIWIPLYISLLFLVLKNNDNVKKIILIIVGAILCTVLAGSLNDMFVKPGIARLRPSRDIEIAMLVDIVNGYRGGPYGFFSSHASNTISIAVFLSIIVRSKLLTVSLVLWSLINCWTRMYLAVHFPCDIFVGLIWGSIVGILLWYVYYKIIVRFSHKGEYISSHYTPTGYQLTDIDIVISVLIMTVLYVIIKSCYMMI